MLKDYPILYSDEIAKLLNDRFYSFSRKQNKDMFRENELTFEEYLFEYSDDLEEDLKDIWNNMNHKDRKEIIKDFQEILQCRIERYQTMIKQLEEVTQEDKQL